MKEKVAQLIKQRRKDLSLSQKDVAQGICTQTIISKIENGETSPSIELFAKIAQRLKLSLNDLGTLFDVLGAESTDFSQDIHHLLHSYDHQTLKFILSKLDYSSLNAKDKRYYELLTTLVNKDMSIQATIQRLSALHEEVDKEDPILLSTILHNLILAHLENNDHHNAATIATQLQTQLKHVEETTIKAKYHYEIARTYYLSDDLLQAQHHAASAINMLMKEYSFYELGELFVLQAQILQKQALFHEALTYYQRAVSIYEIESNETKKLQVLAYLSQLKEQLNQL